MGFFSRIGATIAAGFKSVARTVVEFGRRIVNKIVEVAAAVKRVAKRAVKRAARAVEDVVRSVQGKPSLALEELRSDLDRLRIDAARELELRASDHEVQVTLGTLVELLPDLMKHVLHAKSMSEVDERILALTQAYLRSNRQLPVEVLREPIDALAQHYLGRSLAVASLERTGQAAYLAMIHLKDRQSMLNEQIRQNNESLEITSLSKELSADLRRELTQGLPPREKLEEERVRLSSEYERVSQSYRDSRLVVGATEGVLVAFQAEELGKAIDNIEELENAHAVIRAFLSRDEPALLTDAERESLLALALLHTRDARMRHEHAVQEDREAQVEL